MNEREEELCLAAVVAAKAQGCCCEPEIDVVERGFLLYHDTWCPLLRAMDDRGPGHKQYLVVDLGE